MSISNDFAHLPNEIINDIIVGAVEDENLAYIKHYLESLSRIQGPWSQFAHKMLTHGSVLVYVDHKFCKALDYDKVIGCAEAQNHRISYASIDKNADFEQLHTVAPNFYNRIEFQNVPDIPSNLLLRLGNRFSSVTWNQKTVQIDQDGNRVRDNMKPQVVDFLKRQLRSKHLQKLVVAADGFKQGELDNLLVDFVKRPSFQFLHLTRGAFEEEYLLPFNAITNAYENWNSKTYFEVDQQDICGSISKETFAKLEGYFQTKSVVEREKQRLKATRSHASLKSTKMKLYASVDQRRAPYLHVMFYGMNVRDSNPDD